MCPAPNIRTDTARLLNAYETILNVCRVPVARRSELNTLTEANRQHNSTIGSIAHSILIAKPENREVLEVTEYQGGSVNRAALDTIRRTFSQLQMHPEELQLLSLQELQQLCNLLAIVNEIIGGRDPAIVCESLRQEIAKRPIPEAHVEAIVQDSSRQIPAITQRASEALGAVASVVENAQAAIAEAFVLQPTPLSSAIVDYNIEGARTSALAIETHVRAAQDALRRAEGSADKIVTTARYLSRPLHPTDQNTLTQAITELRRELATAIEAYEAAMRDWESAPILLEDLPDAMRLIAAITNAADAERLALESVHTIREALQTRIAAIVQAKTEVSRLLTVIGDGNVPSAERERAQNQLSVAVNALEAAIGESEALRRAPRAQSVEELQLALRNAHENARAQQQNVHSLAQTVDGFFTDCRNTARARIEEARHAVNAANEAVVRAETHAGE